MPPSRAEWTVYDNEAKSLESQYAESDSLNLSAKRVEYEIDALAQISKKMI